MANNKKNKPHEEEMDGAPEWMVTFSDCMTLLLTFFVLLLSFSTFDEHAFDKPGESLAAAFLSISPKQANVAVMERDQVKPKTNPERGADRPSDPKGDQRNSLEELDPIDFDHHKIFIFTSQTFFYGKGTVVSSAGKKSLKELADVLVKTKNRIMICEYSDKRDDLGIARSKAVSNYLIQKGISKSKICISTTGVYPKNNSSMQNGRAIEIAVLDQNIFN